MSPFSDEPILVQPDARAKWKFRLAISFILAIAGLAIYLPLEQKRLDARALNVERGDHHGTLIRLSIEGQPHTLELAWSRSRFAPILRPTPPEDTTLFIQSRRGAENLTWNTTMSCFGPTKFEINPTCHYEVTLRLERAGRVLWSDTVWAYGLPDEHGHEH